MSIRQGFTMGLAEMMGTAILVFIGCTGCIGSLGISPPLVQKSLSFGLAVMIAIQVIIWVVRSSIGFMEKQNTIFQAIGHISGAHINPAVSVAALIMGSVSLSKFLLYIAAQCIGGILGYGLIKVRIISIYFRLYVISIKSNDNNQRSKREIRFYADVSLLSLRQSSTVRVEYRFIEYEFYIFFYTSRILQISMKNSINDSIYRL